MTCKEGIRKYSNYPIELEVNTDEDKQSTIKEPEKVLDAVDAEKINFTRCWMSDTSGHDGEANDRRGTSAAVVNFLQGIIDAVIGEAPATAKAETWDLSILHLFALQRTTRTATSPNMLRQRTKLLTHDEDRRRS